jgi:hypothetical protein
MLPTVEVRWFHKGPVPEEVAQWFRRGERERETQGSRVDHYHCHTDGGSLGIKVREGMLEIKQRHIVYGVMRFHERVTGVVEHWRKWSFVLESVDGIAAGFRAQASSWLGVNKDRRLRKYQLVGESDVITIPAFENPDRGCSVELTQIRVKGEVWWSLAFEAFGEEATLRDTLLIVAQHVLAREPPLLCEGDSFGYPDWLDIVQLK